MQGDILQHLTKYPRVFWYSFIITLLSTLIFYNFFHQNWLSLVWEVRNTWQVRIFDIWPFVINFSPRIAQSSKTRPNFIYIYKIFHRKHRLFYCPILLIRMAEFFPKYSSEKSFSQLYATYKRLTSDLRTYIDLKWRDRRWQRIFHASENQKIAEVAILISDQIVLSQNGNNKRKKIII